MCLLDDNLIVTNLCMRAFWERFLDTLKRKEFRKVYF